MTTAPSVATPRAAGYRQPAEWAEHRAVWIAWPSHADLWEASLELVRTAWLEMASAVADPDPVGGAPRGERLEVLVPDERCESLARSRMVGLPARFHRIPFGDIWLRDTAPVFVAGGDGVAAVSFAFNGWGGKYVLPDDDLVSPRVALAARMRAFSFPQVLEGGSVEVDGAGTCLTTRQCLLNPNRNPGMSKEAVESLLREALGVETFLWLFEGLRNDHTDGHVDTLARFVSEGVAVCMRPSDGDDPNAAALRDVERDLRSFRDAAGRKLEVVTVPSPGFVPDDEGRPSPASYVNFYIGNRAVVVPTYGAPHDDLALRAFEPLFPGRRVIGVAARDLLSGGGAWHCITQQEPRGFLR
ncbi:MAG TPA: agmatine deiminase family protein [Thermoanaerobaculia bacterium]|nr:agmatine deiminase family protein [Thermoanaerobaculia bacterium]